MMTEQLFEEGTCPTCGTAGLKREVEQRTPKQCPFCWEVDKVVWREFEVVAAPVVYFDRETDSIHDTNEKRITVTCTRCEEEIRPEDVGLLLHEELHKKLVETQGVFNRIAMPVFNRKDKEER